MKYVMIILIAAISTISYAGSEQCSSGTRKATLNEQYNVNTDVPAHLKGATITITLADGRSSTVPAEKFKVVPRKQQLIVKHDTVETTITCSTQQPIQRNRVSVLAGRGTQEGLDRNNDNAPNEVTVENKVGPIFGAQYQYKTDWKVLKMPLSFGVQGQTNKTGSVMVGVDF
jgi:hypothetical protein